MSYLSRVKTRNAGMKELANMPLGKNICSIKSAEIKAKGEFSHLTIKVVNDENKFVFDFLRTSSFDNLDRSLNRIKYLFAGTDLEKEYHKYSNNIKSLLSVAPAKAINQLQKDNVVSIIFTDEEGNTVSAEEAEELDDVDEIPVINFMQMKDNVSDDMSEKERNEAITEVKNHNSKLAKAIFNLGLDIIEFDDNSRIPVLFSSKNRTKVLEKIKDDLDTLIEDEHEFIAVIKKDDRDNLNVKRYLQMD